MINVIKISIIIRRTCINYVERTKNYEIIHKLKHQKRQSYIPFYTIIDRINYPNSLYTYTITPPNFLRGCIGIKGVGRLASRRPIRRARAVISDRLPIIKRNDSAEHSRDACAIVRLCMCVSAWLCACIGYFDRGMGNGNFFFPDSSRKVAIAVGGGFLGAFDDIKPPFHDERKKGGKVRGPVELPIRRSIQAVACEQPPLSGT